MLSSMGGKIDDLNHLHGSQNTQTKNLERTHNGHQTLRLTWDLSRQGTTK
jgi:hypothetical protein